MSSWKAWLRSVADDVVAPPQKVERAVALALFYGVPASAINNIFGHWPRLPDPVPSSHPIWRALP